jgi:hypothetical protein
MGIRNVLYKKAEIIKELTSEGNIKLCSGHFEHRRELILVEIR